MTEKIKVGPWDISYDIEATRVAYKAIKIGGPENCGCAHCANFILQRESLYPKAVIEVFDKIGVDCKKEVEVYHLAKTENGLHLYGGWFHFIGMVKNISDLENQANRNVKVNENFSWWLGNKKDLANSVFEGHPLVQIDFQVKIPWVLESDEPE